MAVQTIIIMIRMICLVNSPFVIRLDAPYAIHPPNR